MSLMNPSTLEIVDLFGFTEVTLVKHASGTGGILFREYCFGEENSLSSAANSVSSARNSVSSRLHTNNRPKGTH